MNPQKKFWKWRNQADGEPEARVLELYGTIASESWFDDDVTPQMFKDELFSGDGDVVIYLNSPGGDCIAASQIYTMLMDYPGNVIIKIDGIAASAASVIAMAGTSVLMAPTQFDNTFTAQTEHVSRKLVFSIIFFSVYTTGFFTFRSWRVMIASYQGPRKL